MAFVLADRVKETTTTAGTGTVTLLGASTGFQSFAAVGNANTTYYCIAGQTTSQWEVGIGTYTSSGTTLARNTVLASSSAGALVNFSAGTKDVFVTYPAEKSVNIDAAGVLTLSENVVTTGSVEGSSLVIPTNTTDAVFTKDDNLTSWDYENKSFSVTAQETVPSGIFFSPDGTRMYVIGSTGDDVNQYSLATAWDVTTASFVRVSAVIGETAPTGIFFKPDGTVMYVTGSTNDTVREFSVGTAWDVSTITFVRDFSFAAQDTVPQGLWFKPDGTKMYMVGSTNDRVYEYNLATAWNVSTASFLQFFSVAAQEATPVGVNFTSDGTRMYVLGATGVDINRYTLSTPWDISTAVFFNNFYVGFQEAAPAGMFIDLSNNVAYVVGSSSDAVFQYNTTTDGILLESTSGLFIEGSLYTNKNLVVTSGTRIDGVLNIAGAVTASSTLVVGSTLTGNGSVTFATTTGVLNLGTSQTTGTMTLGGTAQTGAIIVGQSTAAQTLNIGVGATTSGVTKTINFGTAGLSGSTTTINIGSVVSGATSNVVVGNRFSLTGTAAASQIISSIINASGTAGSQAVLSFDPGNNGFNVRDGQIRATNNGSNQISLQFYTSNAATPVERMRIDNVGNVGIGLTPVANNGILQLGSYASVEALFEAATITASAPAATTNFDVVTQAVQYYTTNASANFTLNIRGNSTTSLNTVMATGQSCTIALLVTNGATAYYPTAYQVDGTSVTPKWQGGTAPTAGNASSIDVYVFTVIKTASATFTVLASQTRFA